jgi:anti-anti-sigma factor
MSTVLLIEDSPTQSQQFAFLLQGSGYDVLYATELEAGLNRIKQGGVDVILLDLTLPDSQGIDTFLRVREANPALPIVVLTGLDDELVAATALQRGAQDYLVKGEVNQNWLLRALRYAQLRFKPKPEKESESKGRSPRHTSVVQWERDGDVTVVRIAAKRLLDATILEQFETDLLRLVQSGSRKVVISFAEVDYISNGAIGALLNVLKRVKTSGGMLRLCNLGGSVLESLKTRQLHRFFQIDDDLETARASLAEK